MQQQWAQQLNPLIANVLLQGKLLSGVSLANGTTVINHGLGRDLKGYMVVLKSGTSSISDNQLINPTPSLTLSLNSSAAITVSLWVF